MPPISAAPYPRSNTCTTRAPQRLGHALRAVGRAVVGDQHLAGNAGAAQEAHRLHDADLDGLRLVQARHHDGQFDGVLGGRGRIDFGVSEIQNLSGHRNL